LEIRDDVKKSTNLASICPLNFPILRDFDSSFPSIGQEKCCFILFKHPLKKIVISNCLRDACIYDYSPSTENFRIYDIVKKKWKSFKSNISDDVMSFPNFNCNVCGLDSMLSLAICKSIETAEQNRQPHNPNQLN
jgi:hypothetical protein